MRAAFAQAAVVDQAWQMPFEAGQGVSDQTCIAGDAKQMLKQGLFELSLLVGVGMQGTVGGGLQAPGCIR